ncbi:MAG: hypothetical protein DDT19_00237 [Syntrophomonadaceae bacterium]|nr:hypothetical protein [Bacillota bacterium]
MSNYWVMVEGKLEEQGKDQIRFKSNDDQGITQTNTVVGEGENYWVVVDE